MTVHVYTSFSYSYLDRARVLAKSLKSNHPDWMLWAVITDQPPPGFAIDLESENFDKILTAVDLFGKQTETWLFTMDIVEACTAVKGRALQYLLALPECTKVMYFDPDIAVFNTLSPIEKLLDKHPVVLTPHQIDPDEKSDRQAIIDNEIASLTYGVFNLGFIAVANTPEGNRFANWWADRLQDWCHDRLESGIFVDQKWCNLIPCFFENVYVLRDPGYNVASWNLSQRQMVFDTAGKALINGRLLRFYHFTKLGPIGDTMTRRYAGGNIEIYELWTWYRQQITAASEASIPKGWWHYGVFDNGEPVPKSSRYLYRDRDDLKTKFDAPFSVANGFYDWQKNQALA